MQIFSFVRSLSRFLPFFVDQNFKHSAHSFPHDVMTLWKLRFNNLCKQIARNTSELRLSANESICKLCMCVIERCLARKKRTKSVMSNRVDTVSRRFYHIKEETK